MSNRSPLCVFCLSPSFSIRTCVKPGKKQPKHSSFIWRRSDYSIPAIRPRFKASNRRQSKYIAGSLVQRSLKTLKLDEVLRTVQEVWKSSLCIGSSCNSQETMERKAHSYSTDIPSPVLLRRRLSAPETIMRKHVLAQQRSESQDSDFTQSSDTRSCQWRNDAGSDPNLNKKRDSGLMRKSTLLRRMWSNSKPSIGSRFSGSFFEWQQSFGKSTHSLSSNHSSPEHKSQSRRTSPQHFSGRKMPHKFPDSDSSKKCMSPKRKVSVMNGNFDYSSFSTTETLTSSLDNRTSCTITPKTESDSTRSTTTSYTTFSDNSDSAFTNSQYSNNNSTTTTSSEITKQFVEDSENSNQEGNQNINLDNKYVTVTEKISNESGTQTADITNLNVISNVQLSQSTLDLIFQQVIQDVNKSTPTQKPVPSSTQQSTQETPSFYLKRKEDVTVDNPEHSRIVKYMISNIGTGSPYSKPAEVPQVVVPRFSALPRTSSMEVNTSSAESDDKSDTISLVDSLEDPHSPKILGSPSPILPDNSTNKKKPSSFFIPIETNQIEMKAVSDLLPNKVREKLAKRQQKREEKMSQAKSTKTSSPRSDSNYISASDNQLHFIVDSDFNLNSTPINNLKHKKKVKPLLPSIESIRKVKADKPKSKFSKRKSLSKDSSGEKPTKQWVPKPRNKLTPISTSKNEHVYNQEPRRIYHKTEFSNNNKRIEILEIMECVDSPEKNIFKGKSKIPVLINQKLPKINDKSYKPAFLDFDQIELSDPKLDQLIANILIDTLNNSADEKLENLNEKKFYTAPSKYQQKFEVIPEEQQSTDISNNNSATINNNCEEASASKISTEPAYKGKAAVAVVRDENLSTIPKGWITFYMLHKNQGSPDSTSDEGKKLFDQNQTVNNNQNINNKDLPSINRIIRKEESSSSSSNEEPFRRKINLEKQKKTTKKPGEWSVTVSGTNNHGHLPPELEMRVSFPNGTKDLGVVENNYMNLRKNKTREPPTSNTRRWLPDIPSTKIKKAQKNYDMEPRQTKTSTRRYFLSRPKVPNRDLSPTSSIFDERDYTELLRHFPKLLSINGRSISPDRK